MLTATRTSALGHNYTLTRDKSEVGTFSLKKGRIGASIELADAEYRVRRHRFSGVHELLAADGTILATTDRVRRDWTLHTSGRNFEFQQTALAGREYTMLGDGGATAGTISRSGPRNANVSADLPGMQPELQVFVLVAVLLRQRRKRAAVTVSGSVLSGG